MYRHGSFRQFATPARHLRFALVAALLAGCGPKAEKQPAPPAAAAKPVIVLIRAADWMGSEWSEDAIKVGLQEEDLDVDRDYTLVLKSAQGDISLLPGLIDAAVDQKAAVIVTLQDVTLQTAVQRVHSTPIVFHVLSDPFAAGAGTSDSNHLANITGVYSPGFGDPEQARRLALILKVVPKAKRLGILFSPGEPLSVNLKDKMTTVADKAGLTVVAMPINSVAEGTEATTALVGKKVDAIEIYGNAAHAAFVSIIAVAKAAKVPVFSPSPFEVQKGATAAFYPDFQEGGVVAGHMIGKILKGQSPATIPFYQIQTTRTLMAGDSGAGQVTPAKP
ncbi:MAG: ABC transporter substrate-binding protein [Gemmatimonadales bacterium]